MRKIRFIGLTMLSVILFTSCSSVVLTGRKQLMLVTDAQVLAMSDSTYNAYIAGAVISKKATQSAMVTKVGRNIANAVQTYLSQQGQSSLIDGYSWDFKLVSDTAVNAFCMPGGKIVVYEGILPVTANETGLAVVIGHEVAHAVAKHANERLSQQMAAKYGAAAVQALLQTKSATVQTIGNTVFGIGAEYGVMLPFSRKQEYEADHLGLIFMAMAGYDPAQAVTFWERMSAQSTTSVPEFLSTHPSDANRIANMKTILLEAQGYYKKK
jgi:predicted Zn-dependent protease